MNTTVEKNSSRKPIGAKRASCSAQESSYARLNPVRLGWGMGATGVIFYLGCMLTMATVSRENAVIFFNSLLHGLNVEPILKTNVPSGEVVLGLLTTFILGWFAGMLIAGFYNLALCTSASKREGKA